MASQPAAQLSHAPSIQRKAVGRLGRVPSNSSIRSSTNASVIAAPPGSASASFSSGGSSASQQSPGYFDYATVPVHHAAAVAQSQHTVEHVRSPSIVSTLPIHHAPTSAAPAGNRSSVIYGSTSAAGTPASTSIAYQPVYSDPIPQPLQRTSTAHSYDSTTSSQPPASPWPATPGSVVSYQTTATTPLSRVPTSSSNIVPEANLVRNISPSSSVSVTHGIPTCNQCRAAIPPNASIFECLVCHVGGSSTRFCVYCLTTGTAASGHPQHDSSFFVTDSDLAIQPEPSIRVGSVQIPAVPPHIWTARKNSAGRVWYQHRATGYRTYLRPMAATCTPSKVPAGWQLHSTPDGKKYYFNASTGASSWTLPTQKSLPPGWKEVRTPDYVSFYVHDEHQLISWERPGFSPKLIKSKSGKVKVTNGPVAGHGMAMVGTATSFGSNIAVTADAADISPQGIIAATVAAAKFTSHGAKVASKKMKLDKLAKSKQIRRASKMFTSAASLAAIADEDGYGGAGGDSDGEGDAEADYAESTVEYGHGTVVDETTGYQQQYAESPYAEHPVQPSPLYCSTAAVQGQSQGIPAQYPDQTTAPLPAPQQTFVHQQHEVAPASGQFASEQYSHGYAGAEQQPAAYAQHVQQPVAAHHNSSVLHAQPTHQSSGQLQHQYAAHPLSAQPVHNQQHTPQHSSQPVTHPSASVPTQQSAQQSSHPPGLPPGSGAAHQPTYLANSQPVVPGAHQPQLTQYSAQESAQQASQQPAQQAGQQPSAPQHQAHPLGPPQHSSQQPAQHSAQHPPQRTAHPSTAHPSQYASHPSAQHPAHASSHQGLHHAPHHTEHRAAPHPEHHQTHHSESAYAHVYPSEAYLPAGSGLPPTATTEPYPTTIYYEPAVAPMDYSVDPTVDPTGYELVGTVPAQEFETVAAEPVLVIQDTEVYCEPSYQ